MGENNCDYDFSMKIIQEHLDNLGMKSDIPQNVAKSPSHSNKNL